MLKVSTGLSNSCVPKGGCIIKRCFLFFWFCVLIFLCCGHAVAQLVEVLRYKPEGRGFDSQWRHWIFSLTTPSSHTVALGLTQPLTEMSTRNVSWG
jgi:hypothetical protein